jgi:hypothetical protein
MSAASFLLQEISLRERLVETLKSEIDSLAHALNILQHPCTFSPNPAACRQDFVQPTPNIVLSTQNTVKPNPNPIPTKTTVPASLGGDVNADIKKVQDNMQMDAKKMRDYMQIKREKFLQANLADQKKIDAGETIVRPIYRSAAWKNLVDGKLNQTAAATVTSASQSVGAKIEGLLVSRSDIHILNSPRADNVTEINDDEWDNAKIDIGASQNPTTTNPTTTTPITTNAQSKTYQLKRDGFTDYGQKSTGNPINKLSKYSSREQEKIQHGIYLKAMMHVKRCHPGANNIHELIKIEADNRFKAWAESH